MRPLYARSLIIGLVGVAATVVAVRAARTIEQSADPLGLLPSINSRDSEAPRETIHISSLFDDLPSDATPNYAGDWAPQAWNRFTLWLETLKGRRIRLEVAASAIRPWEYPDGRRRVEIDLNSIQLPIADRPVWFDVWATPELDGMPLCRRVDIAPQSAQALDEWFRAPQNAMIRLEGTIASVSFASWGNNLMLTDVRVSR